LSFLLQSYNYFWSFRDKLNDFEYLCTDN
jgi:hypothetical protein